MIGSGACSWVEVTGESWRRRGERGWKRTVEVEGHVPLQRAAANTEGDVALLGKRAKLYYYYYYYYYWASAVGESCALL